MERGERQCIVFKQIALADLHESPARRTDCETLLLKCPRKRIQHNVHAAPISVMKNLVGEVERARIHDKLHAARAQEGALLLIACSREHPGPDLLR